MKCAPCDCRGHDCERDGHIAAVDLTPITGTQPKRRAYQCGQCGELFSVPTCDDCGCPIRLKAHVQRRGVTEGEVSSTIAPRATQFGSYRVVSGAGAS